MLTFVCQRRLAIVVASTLAAAVFLIAANQAHAAFNVSDPIPGMIRLVAIDAEPSGNTATSVVDVDPTRTANVGGTFDVDVVVDEIDSSNALIGWDFDFHYNPTILRVTGYRSDLMLDAAGGSIRVDFPDTPPDSDGDFFSNAVDFNLIARETGEGVLVRFTLECLTPGTSSLLLDYVLAGAPNPGIYYVSDPDIVVLDLIPIITNQGASVTCLVPGTPNPAVGGAVSLNVGPDSDAVSLAWYLAPAFALAAAGVGFITSRRLATRRIK